MAIIKCKMCGGDLNTQEGVSVAQCEYCGTRQTVPAKGDERKMTLFARANRLRAACEFDKAAGVYESIVAGFPEEAEAYWGLVLCRYGIEYVDDPRTGKKIPTCHRSSFDSVLDDGDFEQALENADVVARQVYREEAKTIETLRRGIVEVSGKEEPYDIFICYKETDENGNRTVDSVIAQDMYNTLTKKGYRVFFSRITLEQKLGIEYEPYIFAALNSAKLMLVIGTDYEHFNAVWVKNEWYRFLTLMEAGKGKTLIPCYKGIDAYDMPREFAKLQAQDMGKVGAMQDLLRGVDKIMGQSAAEVKRASEGAPVETARPTVQSLTERAHIFLEDGDFESADRYFDRVLDIEPKNAEAYFGKFLAQCRMRNAQELVKKAAQLDIKPRYDRKEACPEDEARIIALANRFEVPSYLTGREIRQELRRYDRTYDTALPYLNSIAKRLQTVLDSSREFTHAEQYAKDDFASYLAGIRKAFAEPECLRDALDKARAAEAETVKSVREGYLDFLEKTERSLAEKHEEAVKAREEDKREEEAARKRAAKIGRLEKMRKRIVICSACLAAVIAIVYMRNTNIRRLQEKYEQAESLLAEGHYDEAIAVFEELSGYEDSAERIPNVTYEKAEALLSSGDYDGAIAVFEGLGYYSDASERIPLVRQEKAQALLADGDYDGAFAVYTTLGEEIPESLLSARYEKAETLLSDGDNARAAMEFGALGDYSDARTRSFELWNEIVERDTFVYDTYQLYSYTGSVLAGIKQGGGITMIGFRDVISKLNQELDTWKDLIGLATAGEGVIALKADGTVMKVDGSVSDSKWDSSLEDVVAVAGSEGNTTFREYVVLKADGTVHPGFTGPQTGRVKSWKNVVQVCCTSEQIAVLKADGTVDSTVERDWEGWTDIISIVALYDDLVGLKKDGTVLVKSGDVTSEPRMGSAAAEIVEGWSDIVKLYGDAEPDKGFAVVMGLRVDGSVLLSDGNAYPPLPEIVMDSMRVMLNSANKTKMNARIYGLDEDGKPMVYTEDIISQWAGGELTDEEAADQARSVIWNELNCPEWQSIKLPS